MLQLYQECSTLLGMHSTYFAAALAVIALAACTASLETEPDGAGVTGDDAGAARTGVKADAAAAAEAGIAPGDAGPADPTASDAALLDATAPDPCAAAINAPPAALGLNVFYTKFLDLGGLPIVSSAQPSDAALRTTCRVAKAMLAQRDDLRQMVVSHGLRIGVMGKDEVTTDMPEHADLNVVFPGTDWDLRARGLGATLARPLSSCAEENVSCLPGDRYVGENIFVHEFAHSLSNLGLVFLDPSFAARVDAAYQGAMAAGRFAGTYAANNRDEYWAEGVQSYFDSNLEAIPANGIHNEINTRAELESYDPVLFALIAAEFAPQSLALCP